MHPAIALLLATACSAVLPKGPVLRNEAATKLSLSADDLVVVSPTSQQEIFRVSDVNARLDSLESFQASTEQLVLDTLRSRLIALDLARTKMAANKAKLHASLTMLENLMASVTSAQCPDGQVVNGFTNELRPTCIPILRGSGACPAGQVVTGLTAADGTPVCSTVPDKNFWQRRPERQCPDSSSFRELAADGTVTCQQDFTAVMNPTVNQMRINGSCVGNQAITDIYQDGSVKCATFASINGVKFQSRINGTCVNGSSIRAVNADGSVVCQIDNVVPSYGVAIYTQWGRKTCLDEFSSEIYTGWIGGANHNADGSGYNQLCMPWNGESGAFFSDLDENGGQLYRTEYEVNYANRMAFDIVLQDREAACSVCKVSASYTLMIPGAAVDCPSGLHLLYRGWIMTTHFTQRHPSEFICVSHYLDSINTSSSLNENGNLLYHSEMESPVPNSANAEGYLLNRELSCAMCAGRSEHRRAYTQWGRNFCSGSNATTGRVVRHLYAGWTASGRYDHQGGGVNYLCIWPSAEAPFGYGDNSEDGGMLYRTQYSTAFGGLPVFAFGSGLANDANDVACSVCETNTDDVLMVPGPWTCPANYELLYKGWLAANLNSFSKPNEFVCVDYLPQQFPGGSLLDEISTSRMYPAATIGMTGAGPTANYKTNYEVVCAMCARVDQSTVSFVRWGRSTCTSPDIIPAAMNLGAVYSGWVGGGKSTDSGSGANMLCMNQFPVNPVNYFDPLTNQNAYIYFTEYSTAGYGLANFVALNKLEVPCSVCTVTAKAIKMIPGKWTCPSGFTRLYRGYLMTAQNDLLLTNSLTNEYTCVDENAEAMLGSQPGDQPSAELFPTEAVLPPNVPGYVDKRELTCIVCALN